MLFILQYAILYLVKQFTINKNEKYMSDEEINNMGNNEIINETEELTPEEAEMRERSEGDYQQDEASDNELAFN